MARYYDIVKSREKFRLEEQFYRLENPEALSRTLRYGAYPLIKKLVYEAMDSGVRGGKVLDLGTPFGLSAFYLKQQLAKAEFFVLQDSPTYSRISKELFEDEVMEKGVSWVTGDLSRPPFRSGVKFRLIISCLDLHRWEDPALVLNQAMNMLSARGRMIIADLRPEFGGLPALMQKVLPKKLLESEALEYMDSVTRFARSFTSSCYTKVDMKAIARHASGSWTVSGSWLLNILSGKRRK